MLFVLPFGEPYSYFKFDILRKNLKVLLKATPGPFTKIVIELIVYSIDLEIPADILEVPNLRVVRKEGIVGDLFRTTVTPERLRDEGFDYLILTLDDVEILGDVDFKKIIISKILSGSHVVSPTLSKDSTNIVYQYMCHDAAAQYTGRVISISEFFFFLMDTKSYVQRYYPLFDEENKWVWGIDLCLYEELGTRTLQLNKFIVKHWIQGVSYSKNDRNPSLDMTKYLEKRNHTAESLWKKKMVLSILFMEHLSDQEWQRIWEKL